MERSKWEITKVVLFIIKAPTALVDQLSLNVGWENGPEEGLKTVSFNP